MLSIEFPKHQLVRGALRGEFYHFSDERDCLVLSVPLEVVHGLTCVKTG